MVHSFPFTKSGKLVVLRKGEYEKIRDEFKKDFGLDIGSYLKYKKKV